MDIGSDVWNQVALEANQLYLEDGTAKSRFADTVSFSNKKKWKG